MKRSVSLPATVGISDFFRSSAHGFRASAWGALAALLVACGPSPEAPVAKPASGKRVIAVIPMGATHNYWKSIHAGALQAAHELGNIEILWKSGLKEDDRDSQIKVVEDMITRKVDGIVLAPLDNTALRPPVEEAIRSGIPVVIVDSDLKSDKPASFIATDNYQGGRKAGELLAKLLDGKGRVAMLRNNEGAASTMAREQGWLDAIKPIPGIGVVSANQYGGATTETAYKASENLLAPFRKADGHLGLDGIFTCNESTTFGMLRALQDAKWAGQVKFVGFDSSEMLVKALEAGQINGLILQNPVKMGYLGVKTLAARLRGEPVERRVDTGATAATPDNMNQPEVRALLEPDIKKWLKE
jgi:ribose transport system substrate-binding protein